METQADSRIIGFTNKVGLTLENELDHFRVHFFKGFTFLPDMAMHVGSFYTTDDFTRVTERPDIANAIGFVFHNIFEDDTAVDLDRRKTKGILNPPYVRIFPYSISQKIHYNKNTSVTHVAIVSALPI